MSSAKALPRPGPRWGSYPQRPAQARTKHDQGPSALGWAGQVSAWLPPGWVMRAHAHWVDSVQHAAVPWQGLSPATSAWGQALTQVKAQLRRDGFNPQTLSQALGCVSAAIEHTLGPRLYPQQLLAAALMLDQQLVEMATGEGKTLCMAAAAAVSAMAGVPTHVITANDYLAQRDATALAPLWQALHLQVQHTNAQHTPDQKKSAYQSDIVYSTAKDIAFEYLRDQQAAPGHALTLRGLSLALLDEADSILLDEAVVPLILSATRQEAPTQSAQRRAIWWQTWSLSGQLVVPTHVQIDAAGARAVLTDAGERQLAQLTDHLPGLWQRARLRRSLINLALTARHALSRDVHYLIREGRIDLLDTLTGRVAEGRVLSQGLHTLIELKEGMAPTPPTDTLAQITFQRFFQRYWRLGGISGTLHESSGELADVYDLRVVRIPTRLPSRRIDGPTRWFSDDAQRQQAIVERVVHLRTQGRPVLVGTDNVEASEALSQRLQQAGVPHVVLNARHDQQEAAIVAQAGRAGAVTVATRMAGRGTDIALDAAALQAGGLHVMACQRNESRRMDRQLLGRCARHGQAGSTETWICAAISSEYAKQPNPKLPRCLSVIWQRLFAPWLSRHRIGARLDQWLAEQRQVGVRRHLLDRDRQWEVQHRNIQKSG